MFGDNGTECDYFYTLLPLQAYGEHMYNDEVLAENIKENVDHSLCFFRRDVLE